MINLLYCGNHKVFDGVLTSLLSIVRRTKTKEPFCVYVFTMNLTRINADYTEITDEQIEFLQSVICGYNPQNRVVKVDVSQYYEREFGYCPNEGAYCSPYTLLRLLADTFDFIPDKLLYLDADVMFNGDIRELYDINIDKYEYAAARDNYGKYLLYGDYINAGVMLYNMALVRKTGLLTRAREKMRSRKYLFADQDAVYYSTTSKLMLPQRFNDQKFLRKNTVVRHFAKRLFWLPYPHVDNVKQWHVDKVRKVFKYKVFDDVLDEYVSVKESYEKSHNQPDGGSTKMNNPAVNLFFSCDDAYIPMLAATLESIRANCDKTREYRIRVLCANNVSDDNKRRITSNFSAPGFVVSFDDVSDAISAINARLHTRDYYSKTTYYRLFIPRLYPQVNKALYLDSDIIVTGDISKLFDEELGEAYVGAIPDGSVQLIGPFKDYVEKRIGVGSYTEYFNAGILLMNLEALRRIDFDKFFLDFLTKVTFDVAQDQDYLNAVCKGNVHFVPKSWNVMPISPRAEGEKIDLIHFNLSFKPWHTDGVKYEEEFWKYADACPYSGEIRRVYNEYDKALQARAEEETQNLIALCVKQAADEKENERIARVLRRLNEKYVR